MNIISLKCFAVLMGQYNECIWSAITSTSDDPLRIHGECAFAVEAAVWQCTGTAGHVNAMDYY